MGKKRITQRKSFSVSFASGIHWINRILGAVSLRLLFDSTRDFNAKIIRLNERKSLMCWVVFSSPFLPLSRCVCERAPNFCSSFFGTPNLNMFCTQSSMFFPVCYIIHVGSSRWKKHCTLFHRVLEQRLPVCLCVHCACMSFSLFLCFDSIVNDCSFAFLSYR